MAFEIELKARVSGPELVRERMEKTALFMGSFEKDDAYWTADESGNPGSRPPVLRIRKETFTKTAVPESHILATYKQKEVRDGIEINEEKEFSVDKIEEFEDFIRLQGYNKQREKRKKGFSYRFGDINAELSEITGLGWFAELEILLPSRDENAIKAARGRLFAYLEELGIEKTAVETRFYSEMLENAQKGLKNSPGPQ